MANGSRRHDKESPVDDWLFARDAEGVIILDTNHRILAIDEGAKAILRDPATPSEGVEGPIQVPTEILDSLRNGHSPGIYQRLRFRSGNRTYVCRICSIRSRYDDLPGRVTVLNLTRDLTIAEYVSRIGTEYRLTVREVEALEGVLRGLSSKEVAARMGISPNTVKAFLRLVMGKMGVSSRVGIVAKLFEP